MSARILVALAVTGLLLTVPAATTVAAQSTETVTLTVSVVDQNGDTISNADLTATWENGSTTETTASNGRAFIDVERGANVTISLSHSAYIRNHPFVVRNATEQDVTIPAYRQGQLSVVVADDSGDIADARVVLRQNGRIVSQASTNENGEVASEPIAQGTYTLAVVKPGYFRNITTVQVGASTRTQIPLERGTVSLTVAVRDSHFSPPRAISNATVSIESIGQLQTLPDGEARVSVPVNAELTLTVGKEGYNDVTTRVRVGESDLRVNVSTNRTPSLRLESISTRVVTGEQLGVRVVDEYAEPVEGATILLDGEAVRATDVDGRATVTVEESGNHTLAASKEGLNSSSVAIRAIPEEGDTMTSMPILTPTEASSDSGSSTPGFTTLTAILAISVSLAILALRRR